MLKDIPELKVKDVAIAIVPSNVPDDLLDPSVKWEVFIINLKQEPLNSVLVSSKGYGEIDGENVKTSELRHFFEQIPESSFAQIEPIDISVFKLHNEYWVSYYINKSIYDKKYLFVSGSILKENFSMIPVINKPGIMIR
jgi:hypothetical protein